MAHDLTALNQKFYGDLPDASGDETIGACRHLLTDFGIDSSE